MAKCGGTSILPDDGIINRLPGFTIPDHRGFTLVGDANRRDIGNIDPRQGFATNGYNCFPKVFWIMFDPAAVGEMLWEFLLRDGHGSAIGIENDGARTGGSLINRQNVACIGHFCFLPSRQLVCRTLTALCGT